MQIAITGASGLIGTALTRSLEADGHVVRPVTRSGSRPGAIAWDPSAGTIDAAALEGVDAVVHLAGEPIASGPWTAAQRARIHDSRSQGTALVARTLAGLDRRPSVLVSGSAVGYYGDRGDERLVEGSAPGTDFLAQVCVDWEAATAPAEEAGIRVVRIRTGIVLDRRGGALAKQLPLFRLGLGGKAGRGTQWLPWITLHDEVRAIRHALDTASLSGPVNLAAPGVVTNAEFTRALGKAVHRPTLLPVPRFVRHAPFGIGDLLGSLLFTSARVVPDALAATGFRFDHERLDDALATVLSS
jgi:uncharacterized protein (TIGR01777 family)